MSARRRMTTGGTGHGHFLWPVLFLLVLVPTACVLWMTGVAVRNARLAARQRLEEAYRGQLVMARGRLEERFGAWREALAGLGSHAASSDFFVDLARSGRADGVVCYDPDGHVAYPDESSDRPRKTSSLETQWLAAQHREFVEGKPAEAAKLYESLATEASDPSEAAGALTAQARCLARAGDRARATLILSRTLCKERFSRATDEQGRLIAADALARAVELSQERTSPECVAAARRLGKRLNDYRTPGLAAGQRRFLMRKLETLLPGIVAFPTLAAEEMAADFVARGGKPVQGDRLAATALADVWQITSADRRVVGLFRGETIRAALGDAVGETTGGARLELLRPNESLPAGTVVSVAAGGSFPGWQLAASLPNATGFDSTTRAQTAAYVWTAVLMVAATAVLAALAGGSLQRQMRLARLRNDLVATVSHELKTPLASMRVLVDTLLDDRPPEESQRREYLQLIAKENLRLSRLIDNFLTFSRMERNRHAFEPRPIEVAAVLDEAVESMRERLASPECEFRIDLEDGLPPIMADFDAMVTAVLNLLDNAYKYSGQQKRITLRAYREDGRVCFAVADNGIGLSRAAARRVFKRFYQVDRRLSRTVGGCGLGLSIVKFIADEHGGSVRVTSRPGQGSTFTLSVPTAEAK